MRLAFSVAVHANPETLLIDEVLAVGDLAFQRKCLNRIDEFKHNGCAIVFVSHDLPLVSQICDHAIWLNYGELVASCPAQDVTNQYAEAMER
jgi:lipopolysaccharide transport system ATP-binding protein